MDGKKEIQADTQIIKAIDGQSYRQNVQQTITMMHE